MIQLRDPTTQQHITVPERQRKFYCWRDDVEGNPDGCSSNGATKLKEARSLGLTIYGRLSNGIYSVERRE